MTCYYAHSPKGDIPAQTYSGHITGVKKLAKMYAQEIRKHSLHDKEIIMQVVNNASEYHDLGKLINDNQKVLAGTIKAKSLPVNHVDAGTAHCLKKEGYSAAVIQAHHCGYPDFITEENKGENVFRDLKIIQEVDSVLPDLERIHRMLIGDNYEQINEIIKGDSTVLLRLLLSCVADADHTDTANHYLKYSEIDNTIKLCPAERLEQLDRKVLEISANCSKTKRNALRNDMYFECRNSNVDTVISSCSSPVGSGKTTAVMAHLLSQAKKRGLRRIFVVLPYTNIIRQSVKTYREMLVLPGENANEVVAELHHRADFESEDARHLTALWRAPIIVTTAVTFFETLASNSTATLRRLHELPGSAIFLDESHAMLPASLLPLAWRWINVFASEWNCYWVLASGSLNHFWTIPEIASKENIKDVPEIVSEVVRDRLSEYEHNRIVYRNDLHPKTIEELIKWVISFPGPQLIIVNTIQSAAMLADYVSEKYGRNQVEHLSTALTPDDREGTLEKVKKRLHNKQDCDWMLIATSCIEAGVNVSFRNGFRELGPLCSLLQTAGRVNREGEYDYSEVWSFCITEDGMLKLNPGLKNASAVLQRYLENQEPIIPELATRSISDEIRMYGQSDKHRKLLQAEEQKRFPQIEHDFKVIDNDTRLVVVNPVMAEKVRNGKISWSELQKVSVQIAKYLLEELRTPEIFDEIYQWNLEYDNFLGYMAGIVKLRKMLNTPFF